MPKVTPISQDPHWADYAEYDPRQNVVPQKDRSAELVAAGILLLAVVALSFLFWWQA